MAEPPATAGRACITIGPAYLPLLDDPPEKQPPVVLVEGNRGSAKTRSILTILILRALRWPKSRWALWRSSRSRLTETVLETLETQVLPLFGMSVPHVQNRTRYTLPNGSMLIPIGLDDIYRGTSAEFAGGYLNEGIEIDTLAEVESLISTLRQTVVPFNQLIIDTNPGAPAHWLNEKAEPIRPSLRKLPANREEYDRLQWEHNHRPAADPKSRWKRIIAGHEDNPGYFDLGKWGFTPMGKRYVETTLDVLTGHLRRRWVNREWTASSGTVYASFNVERHVINPFRVPGDWPTFMAYDAGVDHPTAILWFTISPPGEMYPKGRIYVIREHIMSGRGVKNQINQHTGEVLERGHASYVAEIEQANRWHPVWRYADPQHVFSKKAEGCLAEQWLECGYHLSPWPRTGTNEEAMVEKVRARLDDGSFVVFNTCMHTIMEFQTWSYKRGPGGELPPGDDKFEDRRNDAMDCIKGFVATNPSFDPVQTQVEVGDGHSNHDYSGSRIGRHRTITLRDGRRVKLLEEDDVEQEE